MKPTLYPKEIYVAHCGRPQSTIAKRLQMELMEEWDHNDVIKWKHFRFGGLLRGKSPDHLWIFLTKVSDAELYFFLSSRLTKRLNKQSRRLWFEPPSRSLWRHCNGRQCHELFSIFHIFNLPDFISFCLFWCHQKFSYNDVQSQKHFNAGESTPTPALNLKYFACTI